MSTGDYAIIDIHAHFCSEKELEIRRNHSICTCFSSGTPGEWESIKQFRKREELMFSFGIHPWYADRYEAGDCGDYLRECDMVGEIGMDSVWCRVPLAIQQKRFEKQLQIALIAVDAYNAVGCRGVTRVDFRVSPLGRCYVLELNTSPGFTSHSLVPKAGMKTGLTFAEVCDRILRSAACDGFTTKQDAAAR